MDTDRRTRLVARYLGSEDAWDSCFKGNVIERQDILVKLVPDTVVARDQSYFRCGDPSNKVENDPPATGQLTPMLDHVSFGVSDIARSSSFYDAALGGIGYSRIWTTPDAAGYARSGADEPFAIRQAPAQVPVPDERCHVAFIAPDRDAVRAFYNAAIAHGAQDDGPPGLCAQYAERYYAAFVRDPDGYRIEAVCHE
jgi:catechol 2,3-dioxygenase-like lactoylglutathione lyase family enzyme